MTRVAANLYEAQRHHTVLDLLTRKSIGSFAYPKYSAHIRGHVIFLFECRGISIHDQVVGLNRISEFGKAITTFWDHVIFLTPLDHLTRLLTPFDPGGVLSRPLLLCPRFLMRLQHHVNGLLLKTATHGLTSLLVIILPDC